MIMKWTMFDNHDCKNRESTQKLVKVHDCDHELHCISWLWSQNPKMKALQACSRVCSPRTFMNMPNCYKYKFDMILNIKIKLSLAFFLYFSFLLQLKSKSLIFLQFLLISSCDFHQFSLRSSWKTKKFKRFLVEALGKRLSSKPYFEIFKDVCPFYF